MLLPNEFPIVVAVAVVALLGYVVGRRTRQPTRDERTSRREFKRARRIIRDLEQISCHIRTSLARHHSSILEFKDRVHSISRRSDSSAWKELSEEAEQVLRPTLRLSTEIAHAYDEIRQQTAMLATFTEGRTDSLTGLSNRRALDESITTMFAHKARYKRLFSLVIFDIDHFKDVNDRHGHLYGDQVLMTAAQEVDDCARETDIVARFGGEQFVILMPETDLLGASVLCEQVRNRIAKTLPVTVSGGVAIASDDDSPITLFARADAALYSAKSAGRNVIHLHDGKNIKPSGETSKDPPRPARQPEMIIDRVDPSTQVATGDSVVPRLVELFDSRLANVSIGCTPVR